MTTLTACQLPYAINSGWQQAKLYSKRVKIEKVLQDPKTDLAIRQKLQLVLEARTFAEQELGLQATQNYRQYVALDRPYVSYIVHAAPAFKLESYRWWFPIIGHVPYKGYFSKKDAEDEARSFSPREYDVFVRGVSAYSTLGWFEDPVWSSMMNYSDADLVNTVIHETVHATIFIRSQADFNERMATYLGDFGTELFYRKKEGAQSAKLQILNDEHVDQKLFSNFLTEEIAGLRKWYEDQAAHPEAAKLHEKGERLKAIQERFNKNIKPQLKSGGYSGFGSEPLNNARLLAYGTYYEDLSDFARLRDKLGGDFKPLLAYLRNLASSKDPDAELKRFVSPAL
ncbi:MAG: aminopeptidase [Bdellovibrionales bacterium]